jgi:hypothetical protein
LYQPNESPAPADRLFGHVFGENESGWLVTFTGRQARLDDPDARPNELAATQQKYFRYPEDASAAATYLITQSERGRDAYFSTHLYREAGNRLRSNAVGAMSCCWLDEDDGRFPENGPEPTAVVRSSEARRHLYWRLTRQRPAEWVVEMNRRIAIWAGGDTGKAVLSSVLRVPGTRNFKRHPKIDPVTVEFTGVGAWEPEIMEQAIPLPPEPQDANGARRSAENYDGPETDVAEYLDAVAVIGEVPDTLGTKFAVVCPWVHEHSGCDRTGTYVGQRDGGGLWFHCRHDHCRGRVWADFKRKVWATMPKRREETTVTRGARSVRVVLSRG